MMNEVVQDHRRSSGDIEARVAVLTVSDTRNLETDLGGRLLVKAMQSQGHEVRARSIVRDEPEAIRRCLQEWLERGDLDVICTTGGTGVSRRDTTVEVVESLLDKKLEGFGELFRFLSYQEVGSAALLSRAVGGLAGESFLFALPGSPKAVELALRKLILPEMLHLLGQRRR